MASRAGLESRATSRLSKASSQNRLEIDEVSVLRKMRNNGLVSLSLFLPFGGEVVNSKSQSEFPAKTTTLFRISGSSAEKCKHIRKPP